MCIWHVSKGKLKYEGEYQFGTMFWPHKCVSNLSWGENKLVEYSSGFVRWRKWVYSLSAIYMLTHYYLDIHTQHTHESRWTLIYYTFTDSSQQQHEVNVYIFIILFLLFLHVNHTKKNNDRTTTATRKLIQKHIRCCKLTSFFLLCFLLSRTFFFFQRKRRKKTI